MYPCQYSRRKWLGTVAGAAAGAWLASPRIARGAAPTAPVSIGRSKTYDPSELDPVMRRMFDQLGGLGRLVKGKTVAIKVNLTGSPDQRVRGLAVEDTHWTHPNVIALAAHLISEAGATRVRILESPWATAEPIEQYFQQAGIDPKRILSAGPRVEFENTNYLGNGKTYARLKVPTGGYLFPAFDLNHSYADCDVFVSIAKLKEHATAGVTLSMKNCFGNTPCTIYGEKAGIDEPSLLPTSGRGPIHSGNRGPSKSAPQEKDPKSPRVAEYRVPRTVADLVAARPIHLAIIDGVKSMTAGEGPWVGGEKLNVEPGLLVAGLNPVTTDAVSMALMGFDPMADRGKMPFEVCDSTLRLAEDAGIGTRDLSKIEVIGPAIADVRFDYASIRQRRRAASTRG